VSVFFFPLSQTNGEDQSGLHKAGIGILINTHSFVGVVDFVSFKPAIIKLVVCSSVSGNESCGDSVSSGKVS